MVSTPKVQEAAFHELNARALRGSGAADEVVRASFERQVLMHTIGAELIRVALSARSGYTPEALPEHVQGAPVLRSVTD